MGGQAATNRITRSALNLEIQLGGASGGKCNGISPRYHFGRTPSKRGGGVAAPSAVVAGTCSSRSRARVWLIIITFRTAVRDHDRAQLRRREKATKSTISEYYAASTRVA